MIILSLTVHVRGLLVESKSYYCNVASREQVPDLELARVQQEYCATVRRYAGTSEEAWSDENIIDNYGWDYCEDSYTIVLAYADETEQIYPHLC